MWSGKVNDLRWLIVCDEDGSKDPPVLQYWNHGIECWCDVEETECKLDDLDECNADHGWF